MLREIAEINRLMREADECAAGPAGSAQMEALLGEADARLARLRTVLDAATRPPGGGAADADRRRQRDDLADQAGPAAERRANDGSVTRGQIDDGEARR